MRLCVRVLCFLLLCGSPAWAANPQSVRRGTEITFCESGCTATLVFTNVASLAGAISSQVDLGDPSHPIDYDLRCVFQVNAAVAAGTSAEVYIATSNGTYVDGTVGTASATFATDKRNNLKFVGLVLADQTAATVDMVGSWPVRLPQRYASVGFWNAFGVNLKSGANASRCILTPMPLETP
jgi:hypothetical protein